MLTEIKEEASERSIATDQSGLNATIDTGTPQRGDKPGATQPGKQA